MFIPPGVPNRIRARDTIPRFGARARARVKSVDVDARRRRGLDEYVVKAGKSKMYVLYVEDLAIAGSLREFRAPFVGERRRRVAIGASNA